MPKTIHLADGSIWIEPPDYVDGSGCSYLGNRRHSEGPPSIELLKRYGNERLIDYYYPDSN